MAQKVQLTLTDYRDRVHACWIGKNIGGTLGAPYEGPNLTYALSFYDPPVERAAPNDDLDMQLGYLAFMEEHWRFPDFDDLSAIWLKYFRGYPWDEYGFCLRNLNRGLRPPLSGWFENSYIDNMGAPIRSEIWACLAPANPQLAATLAWRDAVMDHAGGEGVWGEMFWAAVQSAAFVCGDKHRLIEIGLGMIPPWSRIARVIRDVVYAVENRDGIEIPWQAIKPGDTWGQIRERIRKWFGHEHGCHAVQNHGFTVLGWLLGNEFGDALCKAVNCGCDTDCTGATLGATLGLMNGIASIPERWRQPVGDEIVLHYFTKRGCTEGLPTSVRNLTDRVCALLPILQPEHPFATGETFVIDEDHLRVTDNIRKLWYEDLATSRARIGQTAITLYFPHGPIYRSGQKMSLKAVSEDGSTPVVRHRERSLPVDSRGNFTFECSQPETTYRLDVSLKDQPGEVAFVLLSPEAAPGYPAFANIEKCKTCGGSQPATCKCVLGY